MGGFQLLIRGEKPDRAWKLKRLRARGADHVLELLAGRLDDAQRPRGSPNRDRRCDSRRRDRQQPRGELDHLPRHPVTALEHPHVTVGLPHMPQRFVP